VNRDAGRRLRMGRPRTNLTTMQYGHLFIAEIVSLATNGGEMDDELISICGFGGDCGEPSSTTLKGYPICSECGRLTRNKNALVCRDCRDGFLLSASDRKLLKSMGVKR